MPLAHPENAPQTWKSHNEGQADAGGVPTRQGPPDLRRVAFGHRLSALIAPRGAAVTAAGAIGRVLSGRERCWLRRAER
jgi:hypothetical protein